MSPCSRIISRRRILAFALMMVVVVVGVGSGYGQIVAVDAKSSELTAAENGEGAGSGDPRTTGSGDQRTTGAVAETSPKPPAAKHGFQCRSFTVKDGTAAIYTIFVPYDYRAGDRPPVMLFLNGVGENGNDGVMQISNNFGVQIWEMRPFFPFLTVIPQCSRRGNWSVNSKDTKRALEILDSVMEEFGADGDRVYLTGVSSGGNGVWCLATEYPERFAAIVPLCAVGGGDPQRIAESCLPVWAFYNKRDFSTVVNFHGTTRQRLIELGQSPLIAEYDNVGHDCWNRAYRCTAMYAWLLTQNRTKNKSETRFQYWPGEQLVRKWRGDEGGEWTARAEMVVGKGTAQGKEPRIEDIGVKESLQPIRKPPSRTGQSHFTPKTPQNRDSPRRFSVGESDGVAPPIEGKVGTDEFSAKAGSGRGLLMSPVAGRGIEVHADFWLDAGCDVKIGVVDATTEQFDDETRSVRWGRDLFVSIVLPDSGAGGLCTGDGRWLSRLDSGAQRTLNVDAWNDVRVRLADGRLAVHINGWAACDVELPPDVTAAAYRCALVTPSDGSEGRWRFVRTRVLGDEATASQTNPKRERGNDEKPLSTLGHAVHSEPRDQNHDQTNGETVNGKVVGRPEISFKTPIREGEAPAEPVFSAASARRAPRPPGGGTSSSPSGVEDVLVDWAGRESSLTSGRFEWHVLRRIQSESFGNLTTSENSPSSDGLVAGDHPGESIRIIFDDRGFRLDGESIPSVGLGQLVWAAVSGLTVGSSDDTQFVAALQSRFSDPKAMMLDGHAHVPYRLIVDSVREVHFWEQQGDSYPRAIVLKAGTAQRTIRTNWTYAVPVYSGIVEAFCKAVRPLHPAGGKRSAEYFRVLPDCPVVDGQSCVLIEERLGDGWDGQTRRIWVDPSRGNAIVRCLYQQQEKLDGPQYDIEYDQDESGRWLPRMISVLRMSPYGDPLDAISLVRRSVVLNERTATSNTVAKTAEVRVSASRVDADSADKTQGTESADLFAWEPCPGTWVDDAIEKKQYFVRANGSRRNIEFSENVAGLTYAELQAEGDGRAEEVRVSIAQGRSRTWLAATALKAIAWPGILVTLSATLLLGKGCQFGYGRWSK